MPTIGQVYDPLIAAALAGDENGYELLLAVGEEILKANPERCPDLADGVAAAKRNLDYYCQYLGDKDTDKVKAFYALGAGFVALSGEKAAPLSGLGAALERKLKHLL